jgi:hypothetical protein
MKRLLAALLLLAALAAAIYADLRRPIPQSITPSLTGKPEYCLTCHSNVAEISPSHPVIAFGCVICHGGERLATDSALAHASLRGGRNPSDLSVAAVSCGGANCHTGAPAQERDHVQRVQSSLQSTYAGAIASIRYTFGAQPDLNARQAIRAVSVPVAPRPRVGETDGTLTALIEFNPSADKKPVIDKFAANCAVCHLGAPAPPGPASARFTGCAACHTPTAGQTLPEGGAQTNRPLIHHLATAIAYTQCNTCHNRGNYDLRKMEFIPRNDQPQDRLHDYYQPISQFTRCEYVLDCVDCHTRLEVMGDGNLYNNQKEIQYVQCRDCHGTLTDSPRTRKLTDPNDAAFRLAFLNPVLDLQVGDTILVTSANEPLWNTRLLPDGQIEMIAKVTKTRLTIPPVMGTACPQRPDQQESKYCHACHAVQR